MLGNAWKCYDLCSGMVGPPACQVSGCREGAGPEACSCRLQAMGWKEGQGLGANKDGIAAPISAASGPKQPTDKGGLGQVVSVPVLSAPQMIRKPLAHAQAPFLQSSAMQSQEASACCAPAGTWRGAGGR